MIFNDFVMNGYQQVILSMSAGYVAHVYKREEIVKAADNNAQELEKDLIDSDSNIGGNTLNDDDDETDD
ncbi:unnamed protein product [Rotaria sp. Silwood2]|nr:unnamed protein product [Rotaria sp. Silwood2]CAF3094229.1 unnamed protein product [Rotaria sp. Silwood2]CAF3412791.1 unnamed protein product [Rotaria sp. Silwood2]CAF4384138.1 unnamed protein product [Rotaria sp. Silwood2]CAF4444642.1 unnamed protein product [Rotaria sp. Silwood2]